MTYVCPLCSIDPSNHSLSIIKKTDDVIFLYACPSDAKLYFDCNGIINHYNGVLSEIPKNKKWIWIFDSKNFNFNHFIQFDVAIQLAKLITSNFSQNLSKIIIINQTAYISLTYKLIKPFLNDKVKDTIIFDTTVNNVNEAINNFI